MEPLQRKFLEDVDNATHICFEIKWLLTVLRDYCEFNEDSNDKFLGLTELTELIINKNSELLDQMDGIESFFQKLDFN